jgi:hypothetical protein
MVDRVKVGEVRLEKGKRRLLHQQDHRITVLLPLERPSEVIAGGRGTLAKPNSGANTSDLARPWHNPGQEVHEIERNKDHVRRRKEKR